MLTVKRLYLCLFQTMAMRQSKNNFSGGGDFDGIYVNFQ